MENFEIIKTGIVLNKKHLMKLLEERRTIYLSANTTTGCHYEYMNWDGKEITDGVYEELKRKIGCGCKYLGFIDFVAGDDDGGTIICDEEGLPKHLEINDFASALAGSLVVGNVIVAFP